MSIQLRYEYIGFVDSEDLYVKSSEKYNTHLFDIDLKETPLKFLEYNLGKYYNLIHKDILKESLYFDIAVLKNDLDVENDEYENSFEILDTNFICDDHVLIFKNQIFKIIAKSDFQKFMNILNIKQKNQFETYKFLETYLCKDLVDLLIKYNTVYLDCSDIYNSELLRLFNFQFHNSGTYLYLERYMCTSIKLKN